MNGFRGKCAEKNLRTNAPEFIGPFRQAGGPKKEVKNKTWYGSDVTLNFWVIYFLAETVSGNRDAVLTHRLRGRITRVIQFILYITDCLLGPYRKILPEVKTCGPSEARLN